MESKQKKLPLLPGTNHFNTYFTRIFQRKKYSPFLLFFTWRFCCETAWKPTHYSIPVYPSNDCGSTYRNNKFLQAEIQKKVVRIQRRS
jgi:hypothetical protein